MQGSAGRGERFFPLLNAAVSLKRREEKQNKNSPVNDLSAFYFL